MLAVLHSTSSSPTFAVLAWCWECLRYDKGEEKSESRTYEHAQSKGGLSDPGSGCHRAAQIRRVWVQGDELPPRTDGQEVGEKVSGPCRQSGVTTAAG